MGYDFDVALLLVLATGVAGAIWLIDAVFFARQRARDGALEQSEAAAGVSGSREGKGGGNAGAARVEPAPPREPIIVEYARSFFPVLLIVLLLRSFVVEPFRIPSGSMMPTLLVGDFILVNKFTYGIRWPVLNSKVIEIGAPERGDVAVFRYPKQPDLDYIKRIIGLPGDHIAYYNKTLFVNGEQVPRERIGPYASPSGRSGSLEVYAERLGEVEHQILVTPTKFGHEGEYVVPAGEYFVMGDNRDNSNDGRYWGYVPEDHLVGKAFMIWMNWDWGGEGILWSRIGNIIE